MPAKDIAKAPNIKNPSAIKGLGGRAPLPSTTKTSAVTIPTKNPRVTPAAASPNNNSPGPKGGISKSTILPCTLETTSDDEVLAKAFCKTFIITRPGTRNVTKSISPAKFARSPMATENTIKNNIDVITGAARLCIAIFMKRCTSRWYNMPSPTQFIVPM